LITELNLFCLCSNSSFQQIIERQEFAPMETFDEMIEAYTSCKEGCGTCIEKLKVGFERCQNTTMEVE
jgi:hypothetical protein